MSLEMGERLRLLLLNLIRRRLKLLIILCLALFAINVYVICLYFELYDIKTKDETVPHEKDIKGETSKSFPEPNKNGIRVPRCAFSDSLADSAFSRMKTEECRRKLEDAVCEMDPVGWPAHEISNTCPNFVKSSFGLYRGCYNDNLKKRLLNGFKYDLKDKNSPEECIHHCLRSGFQLAGVEFTTECFCGKELELENGVLHENATECLRYSCPGNESLKCGGFNAISVYNTGVQIRFKPTPTYVELTDTVSRDVKILFLLQLNGRNSRQIKRLLKLIYQPKHFYFIHVDNRQKFMQQEMMDIQLLLEQEGYNNFHVTDVQYPTIWGGSSLLDMFLYVVKWTLSNPHFQHWDYIFNLSESDFPVLSLAELEAILATNKGNSFISAHGYNTGTFLKKQGYNFHFLQCENRMWRFSARNNYPKFLRVDGGSDWVIIHREFAKFAVSDLELPIQMRKLFTSILLPLEGFFHTLALNTEFCGKILYNNLRFTNWKRSQGCRCGALKNVVDWCGCSPLALLHTEEKVSLNRTISKVNYFARKFESLIDIESITNAESQVLRFESHKIQKQSPVFNTTWVNFFDRRFDSDNSSRASYTNLAHSLYNNAGLKGGCNFGDLLQIHVYKSDLNAQLMLLFLVVDSCGTEYELQVFREHQGQIFSEELIEGYKLTLLEHGMMLDLKEEIFRDFVSMLHRDGTVVFQFQWQPIAEPATKRNTTSPNIVSQLFSLDGKSLKRERLRPYDSIDSMQHLTINLVNLKKIVPGVYEFALLSKDNIRIASIEFPIFPKQLDDQFRELSNKFYKIKSVCVNGAKRIEDLKDCRQTVWSSRFPDLKTQINIGFNEEMGLLI